MYINTTTNNVKLKIMAVLITFSMLGHTIRQQGYQKKEYLICRLYVNLYLFACERLSENEKGDGKNTRKKTEMSVKKTENQRTPIRHQTLVGKDRSAVVVLPSL